MMKTSGHEPTRPKLPIGIQSFRDLREGGYYYVDKTDYALSLVTSGKHYFLSRPRRFGKSLFVDTLENLFEGNETLFKGLAIHERWDWSVKSPVIRLDFAHGDFTLPDYLNSNVLAQLEEIAMQADIAIKYDTAFERFKYVIDELKRQRGQQVAVLIDEYDKPIVDALSNQDLARKHRNYLRGLYSVLKSADNSIRFSLITGISKFSKVSLFSSLNNLKDITLNPNYANICGYTELDLDTTFKLELSGLDRDEIRDWYKGYSWLGEERVYNPYDILFLFDTHNFEEHWFETGTPLFLLELFKDRQFNSMNIDGAIATEALLSKFDVDSISFEALLFQTGYLTIERKEQLRHRTAYRLTFPNREVRQGFNRTLLDYITGDESQQLRDEVRLYDLLEADDVDGMRDLFHALYASIPFEWYTNNNIANYEGFYAAVLYSHFLATGLNVVVEESMNIGRMDIVLRFDDRIYIFEFKVVEHVGKGAALRQIKEKGYAIKYIGTGAAITMIGVEFGSDSRNIEAFDIERIENTTP